jgi:hypothetical protein
LGLLAASLVACISCSGVRTVLIVAPYREPCVGVGPRECLVVRHAGDDEWQFFYDSIEGFRFVPGYQYTLLVRKSRISEPLADGSSVRWQLIRELNRVLVEE